MHNASGMTVSHCIDYLHKDSASLDFINLFVLFHILEEFTPASILHYHDQLLAFHKGVVQLHNVFVIQLLQRLAFPEDVLNAVS